MSTASLCDELKAYCEQHKLPFMSADELLVEDGLTVNQKLWLVLFIETWDAAVQEEAAEAADEEHDTDGCSNSLGHSFICTGTAYGGDDERYHGEGRCYCIHCGADGDA